MSGVAGFTTRQLTATLGALIVAVFLASLESTIVTTALPVIAGELEAFEGYAWVSTAYIVTSAIATPILGKLSDVFGRRVVFQATMATFFVGTLLCGVAQTMPQLVAARAVQGVGGGAIMALAFAILGDILSPRERGRYIGYFTVAFAGAALAGPLVGGFIVDRFDWHWLFLVNLPLIAAAGVCTHLVLRLPFTKRRAPIDWTGAALLSIALAALLISLERGRADWTSPTIVGGFTVALGATLLFVLQERRAPDPMIPLRLFADPVIRSCFMIGLLIGAITYGSMTFMPLFFQDSQFLSPTASGLRQMPVMIGVVVMSFAAGRLISRTGRYRPFPILGCAAVAVGILGLVRIEASTPYVALVVPLALIGLGSGAVYTTTSIAAQNACALADLGVTTATVMFARSLGGSFGLAAFSTMLTTRVRGDLPGLTGLSPDDAVALIRTPAEIEQLPTDTRSAVVDVIAAAVASIMVVSVVVMVVALVFALVLPGRPLRSMAGITEALTEQREDPADALQGGT
jgi:EmrB/QacA subfamily drug resistance transporter